MSEARQIVVIGGGHAGIEAAAAAARRGCAVTLVTLDPAAIGRMSCNPAIGGIGKGQIVREIDALGGLMGVLADATAVQFRMLNRSKGKAVWGPRCQSDRHAYERAARAALAEIPGLTVRAGQVERVLIEPGSGRPRVVAVGFSDGTELPCAAAVVSAGTFLQGLLHRGEQAWPGGRDEEPAAEGLSDSLRGLGLELGRLKTGTCARIAAETIDYDRCERQDGDAEPIPFSRMSDTLPGPQLPCWITRTNPAVHELVRANFHRAPMYTGQITSAGPRYCPSFETKVERFADLDSHQLFLEPEGRDTNWVYINGLSTSLPIDVQRHMLAGIAALERAEVLRWGYAIEYDFAPPQQVTAALETKAVAGLYLAGQVLGTTGYEEAAALGLVAGANAAAGVLDAEPLLLGRDQAYIGVMIDDLVTKGVREPYRMFTSRAEHRLSLRADNAEARLGALADRLGLLDEARATRFAADAAAAGRVEALLDRLRHRGKSLRSALANPQLTPAELLAEHAPADDGWAELARIAAEQPIPAERVFTDCRYAGYVERQRRQSARLGSLDHRTIPETFDYARVPQLRAEARQRLSEIRPRTLGQALRISGITPADVSLLMIEMQRQRP